VVGTTKLVGVDAATAATLKSRTATPSAHTRIRPQERRKTEDLLVYSPKPGEARPPVNSWNRCLATCWELAGSYRTCFETTCDFLCWETRTSLSPFVVNCNGHKSSMYYRLQGSIHSGTDESSLCFASVTGFSRCQAIVRVSIRNCRHNRITSSATRFLSICYRLLSGPPTGLSVPPPVPERSSNVIVRSMQIQESRKWLREGSSGRSVS